MLFIVITMYFVLDNAFQLKHFLADYPLQNEYMLGKFKDGWDWVKPLAAHSGLHAFFTFCILTALCPWLSFGVIFFLSIFDFVIHFAMDRIKASPNMLGYFKPLTAKDYPRATDQQKRHNKYFWWALGLDQDIHHRTHSLIVYIAILMFIMGLG